MSRRGVTRAGLVALIAVSGLSAGAGAAAGAVPGAATPGTLDPGFGSAGVVQGPNDNGSLSAVALQVDGKIVVGGWSDSGPFVARYLADGTADASFGTGGTVAIDSSNHLGTGSRVAVAVQGDGNILVAAQTLVPVGAAPTIRVRIARLTPLGASDGSFGATGAVVTSLDSAGGVAIQSDGRVVVAGAQMVAGRDEAVVARYNPDGSLDTHFGAGGSLALPQASQAAGVALGPRNQLLVALGSQVGRLNADGSPDTSFGVNGLSTPVADASLKTVLAEPAGGAFAAGVLDDRLMVEHVLASGKFDATFGDGGVRATRFANAGTGQTGVTTASALILEPDRRLLVAGSTSVFSPLLPGNQLDRVFVARYNALGGLDCSFGTLGTGGWTPGGFAGAGAAALQPDGKIVVGGRWVPGGDVTTGGLAVLRFLGGDDQVPYPATGPSVTTGLAVGIGARSAELTATANPGCAAAQYAFRYGTTPALGATTSSASAGSGADDALVGQQLPDLEPNTVYYFQAVATNAIGSAAGALTSFTTERVTPRALTIAIRRAGRLDLISGRLTTGLGGTPEQRRRDCTGVITIELRRGRARLAGAHVQLAPDCGYRVKLPVGNRRGKTVIARYGGNSQLDPIPSGSAPA